MSTSVGRSPRRWTSLAFPGRCAWLQLTRCHITSGLVDAQVSAPVIACPPYSDAFAGNDVYSSLRMPSGVAPAVVLEPKNTALLAAKMLSLSEPGLREKIGRVQEEQRQRLLDADAEMQARADVSTC